MGHDEPMTKRFISQVSFHSAAVVLALYLANGLSVTSHVVYLSVAVSATFMSQRRQETVTAPVSHLPEASATHEDHRVMTLAHVEDMLSHAS